MKTKKVWWIVGEQQAGKTMLSTVLGSFGARVIHIGEELRFKHTVQEFAEADNPYAPEFTETVVQQILSSELKGFYDSESQLLIFDSAPRSVGQFNIMVAHQADHYESTLVIVSENFEIRRNRARARYKNDLSLFDNREAYEKTWLDEVQRLCTLYNIPILKFK
jgi:dephospho-CoA kinase